MVSPYERGDDFSKHHLSKSAGPPPSGRTVRRLPTTLRGCDPAVMFPRALALIRSSLRVLWAEQSLILLAVAPMMSFLGIITAELIIATIAPTAAVALLIPAAAFVVFLSMFWSAAIVAGANEVAEERSPTVATATRIAATHAPAIAAWAFWSLTVGLVIRFFSSLLGRFAIFAAYTGDLAWSVGT